jgi:hypothetical protein
MGMMYAYNQEKAARYLVKVLEAKGGKVHYSEFYDATEETALRLYAGMGIDEDEGEWICAESVMDVATAQMEAQGFVSRIWHEGEELADGEPAYSIELTGRGGRSYRSGSFRSSATWICETYGHKHSGPLGIGDSLLPRFSTMSWDDGEESR